MVWNRLAERSSGEKTRPWGRLAPFRSPVARSARKLKCTSDKLSAATPNWFFCERPAIAVTLPRFFLFDAIRHLSTVMRYPSCKGQRRSMCESIVYIVGLLSHPLLMDSILIKDSRRWITLSQTWTDAFTYKNKPSVVPPYKMKLFLCSYVSRFTLILNTRRLEHFTAFMIKRWTEISLLCLFVLLCNSIMVDITS